MKRNIGIIGCGNLGKHILKFLSFNIDKNRIYISRRNVQELKNINQEYNVFCTSQNIEVAKHSDVIFLTAKPSNILHICQEIGSYVNQDTIVLSAAAGVSLSAISKYFNSKQQIIRCMPNICISENVGIVSYKANSNITEHTKITLEDIMCNIKNLWLDSEDKIDMATVVLGCGPAYLSQIFDYYIKSAIRLGLTKKEAEIMAYNTIYGTLVINQQHSVRRILDDVSSKGGATEKGLEILRNSNISIDIDETFQMSYKQVQNISRSI